IISERKLIFGGDLNIVPWFELAILHIVVFHPHKRGIDICFGITVSLAKKPLILILLTLALHNNHQIFCEIV
ncbi:hypothetical protein P4U44_17725, partial [Alkalihalobacillus alcalophilus]|uniref:hypothetical protein n=1 Tax=Alkalihalobacillus alcalophilus TaxID=1445 RepID=UPI002E1BBAB5|nr:hypothetical protein [Alkalihalobacillus alcalophilus]